MRKSLKCYNQKRDFTKTKEPRGKVEKKHKKLRFVVQHHIARRDHYDFRLEDKGVLKSFAVPKGPSYNPKDKRLAVQVEDHPLSYRNFEGVIPEHEYGAGPVMLFDEGTYEIIEGSFLLKSIKFILHGKRLKGKWTLVHFKENNWLLIKEEDGICLFSSIDEFSTSIRTKRTMEDIIKGKKKILNSKKDCLVEGIKITNPYKKIFKNPSITKYDIALYYKAVASRMLPLIERRIFNTIRSPEGMEGESFFKKHFENTENFLGEKKIRNKIGKLDDYYFLIDEQSILSEVQMNSYEFHICGSHVDNMNYPDMLVFDLDPDENLSIAKVRECVKDLKSILDKLKLRAFLKTSGGKGYHVVVPTRKLKTWKQARDFAQNIALLMETTWPDKYTSIISKNKRQGKIFIDWLRNTKGATSVAPYSLRLRKHATVSMPIAWSELDKVKPNEITIKEAINRLKRKDPWEHFFDF